MPDEDATEQIGIVPCSPDTPALIRFTSDRERMGEFANRLWLKILGWMTTVIIITLNLKLLFDTFMPRAVLSAVYGTLGLPIPQ